MADTSTVVAVFNTSEDTTDMLRVVLEFAGFVVLTAFTHALRDGKTDLEGFMRQYRPSVVVYDIALPYEPNWRLFERIRDSPACAGVRFVLTSTNVAQVRAVAGDHRVHEIVGKPYDLDELVRLVRAATESRQ
jgi:DNA-binding response OmpR family regulator